MMGQKDRSFAVLPPVTLEDLVPPDHFSRHLEQALDLGFVRDLVGDTYAEGGRPSIDPVVFFKTHPRHCPYRADGPHRRHDPGR